MMRPDGPDSHAVSHFITDLAEWSKSQPRGSYTLSDLIMLAQFISYGAPPNTPKTVGTLFGGEATPAPEPERRRVRLVEAMARGWDGEIYLSTCRWWRHHWIHPENDR